MAICPKAQVESANKINEVKIFFVFFIIARIEGLMYTSNILNFKFKQSDSNQSQKVD